MGMIARDPEAVYITGAVEDKKPIATYLPNYDVLLVGTYLPGRNCGGCDSVPGPQAVYAILRQLWSKRPDIIFEGVIIGDNKIQTYNAVKQMQQDYDSVGVAGDPLGRQLHFVLVDTPLNVCLERIKQRNAGKSFNPRLVDKKFRAQVRYWNFLTGPEATGITTHVLRTEGTRGEVLELFLRTFDLEIPKESESCMN